MRERSSLLYILSSHTDTKKQQQQPFHIALKREWKSLLTDNDLCVFHNSVSTIHLLSLLLLLFLLWHEQNKVFQMCIRFIYCHTFREFSACVVVMVVIDETVMKGWENNMLVAIFKQTREKNK